METQSAVIQKACHYPLFAATVKALPHAARFLHVTANSQKQVNKMHPCKKEETKEWRGALPLHLPLSADQPPREVIDPGGPLARLLSRRC